MHKTTRSHHHRNRTTNLISHVKHRALTEYNKNKEKQECLLQCICEMKEKNALISDKTHRFMLAMQTHIPMDLKCLAF